MYKNSQYANAVSGAKHIQLVTIHGGHLFARVPRTRSIGRSPDVEKRIKSVLPVNSSSQEKEWE